MIGIRERGNFAAIQFATSKEPKIEWAVLQAASDRNHGYFFWETTKNCSRFWIFNPFFPQKNSSTLITHFYGKVYCHEQEAFFAPVIVILDTFSRPPSSAPGGLHFATSHKVVHREYRVQAVVNPWVTKLLRCNPFMPLLSHGF